MPRRVPAEEPNVMPSRLLPRALPRAVPLALLLSLLAASPAGAQTNEEFITELQAQAAVSWHGADLAHDPVYVRILGINDFHGELVPRALEIGGRTRLLGGAATLAGYVSAASGVSPDGALPPATLILIAGDTVGASPPISGLLRDEPTLAVFNEFAGKECPRLTPAWPSQPSPVPTRCHVLAVPGNHEFDRGTAEFERQLYGGKHPGGAVLGHDWEGMRIPYLAANITRRADGRPLLPASAVIEIDKVRIGIIGAITAETPGLVVAGRIADLAITAEAAAINAEVAKLKALHVNTIVLVIHEGLRSPVTPQWVAPLALEETSGRLAEVLGQLDGGIDVVVAGHTHKFNNLMVPLKDGKLVLVTQAIGTGSGLSLIDLTIDRPAGTVIAKSARIATLWADGGAGLSPSKKIARIVNEANKATAAVVARPIGVAAAALIRAETSSGESPLGNFVAEAQRAAAGSDFAFVNAGGLRSDLPAGPITFGSIYAVEPFGNVVTRVSLTGAEVLELLEEQWSGAHAATPRFLRSAGLRYVFDLRRAPGHRVIAAWDAANQPLDRARRYTVAVNDFLLGGGDFYPVLARAEDPVEVMTDIAALEAWIKRSPGPIRGTLDGRIERVDTPIN